MSTRLKVNANRVRWRRCASPACPKHLCGLRPKHAMRALQLLAIAAICPLVVIAAGCEHIVQPVGTYETSQPVPLTRPTSALTPDAHVRDGTEPRNSPPANSGSDSSISLEPPTPVETSADAAVPDETPNPIVAKPPPPSARDSGTTPITVPPPVTSVCMPTSTIPAQLPRFDAYIVMDANFTLPVTADVWEFAITGLRDFWHDSHSAHLGLGLRFYGSDCVADAYDDMPTVEIDLAGRNYSEMMRATATRLNLNASAMGPALEGGIQHQTTRAGKKDAAKQIVILLTDGFVLNDTLTLACPYSENQVVTLAEKGFKATPSVETYVIGFGLPATGSQVADDIIARVLPLNRIAYGGGGRAAQTLEVTDDASKMTEALHNVRRDAQPAEFPLPAGVDRTKLSLVFEGVGEIPRVDSDAVCGQQHGWYFNKTVGVFGAPAPAPTTAQLCPETQTLIEDHPATFVIGCPPKRRVD
jgi:hypothetical protein